MNPLTSWFSSKPSIAMACAAHLARRSLTWRATLSGHRSTCDTASVPALTSLLKTKVFDQIDGRGVQADCTPPPVAPPAPSPTTPPTGSSSFYSLTVVSSQCGCVIGPVQIRSNGAVVGNLTCPQTASFTIPANAFVSVCDNTGCWFGSGFTMTGSRTIGLACSATARQPQ